MTIVGAARQAPIGAEPERLQVVAQPQTLKPDASLLSDARLAVSVASFPKPVDGVPSADWRIREIPNHASSPKTHGCVACLHYQP